MPWCDPADQTPAIITPEKQINGYHGGAPLRLPEVAVVFFMGAGMEVAQSYPHHILSGKFPRFLRACPIGQFDVGNRACFINGGSGAPMAADTLECLHACGVRRVVALGMCGVYRQALAVGDILLPPKVWVEEGTSRHYVTDVQWAYAAHHLVEQAAQAFPDAHRLPTVSSDAIYRQTFHKEHLWRSQGCAGVDMETSAIYCVGQALGMEAVALLVASDKHPEHPGDPAWAWSMTRDLRWQFLRRGIDFALTI